MLLSQYMNKVLVIIGPTAMGKTDLALILAKKFNGELVSCDSRQVYTGLDIGTGKMPGIDVSHQSSAIRLQKGYWEINGLPAGRQGVKIWMYDVVNPKVQYNVADYVKDAQKAVEDITKRGKLPILVGGTGLYLKALLEGLPNLSIPVDEELRKELTFLTKEQLQDKLQNLDKKRWENLNQSDKQNPRRLIRAIELILSTKNTRLTINDQRLTNFNTLKIGLTASRERLYQRVDQSVLRRLENGMLKEAEKLNKQGLTLKRMRQLGLEYGVLADYLEGKIKDKQELIKILQGKIHGFVRRQLTWFKREKDVNWIDITIKNYLVGMERLVRKWYDNKVNDT